MAILAKIDTSVATQRGPDLTHKIRVRPGWLANGATLRCSLPRRLRCARCEGGGCDLCDRSGVFNLRESNDGVEQVVVHLSGGGAGPRLLRVPEYGAPGGEGEPRGCLLLTLAPGEPDPCLVEVLGPASQHLRLSIRAVLPWLILALCGLAGAGYLLSY